MAPCEDTALAASNTAAGPNVGFLTIQHEPSGYLGGYLVVNSWGRPLEFRLSTAVQPNRVQQILYGGTLEPYICADLIGKTLVEKTGLPVQLIVTDCAMALDLRLRLDVPVVWLAPAGETPVGFGEPVRPPTQKNGAVFRHLRFPEDASAVSDLLERLGGTLDLAEPLARIRAAMGEARKLGALKSA
jgi:hypothetical protein